MTAERFKEKLKCITLKVEELSQVVMNRDLDSMSYLSSDIAYLIYHKLIDSDDFKVTFEALGSLYELADAYRMIKKIILRYEKSGLKSLEHVCEIMKKLEETENE